MTAESSRLAWQVASAAAGGMLPIEESGRRFTLADLRLAGSHPLLMELKQRIRGVMPRYQIRNAVVDDLPALVDIFNFYVADGHVTFTTTPHTAESRIPWFESYSDGPHQLLVCVEDSRILGCAYSSRYRPGSAFDTTVETSIYLHPEARGRRVGQHLYSALFDRLATQPLHLAVAGIALPNPGSIALHYRMGFEEVGTFREYAFKRGQWISSTWLQRPVGMLAAPPPDRRT